MSRGTEQAGRGYAIEAWRFRSTLTLLRTGVALGLLGFVAGAVLAGLALSEADTHNAIAYASAEVKQRLAPSTLLGINDSTQLPPSHHLRLADETAAHRTFWQLGFSGGFLALLLGLGGSYALRRHWINAAERAALDQVLRGNRLATADELTRLIIDRHQERSYLYVGGVPVPPQDEVRHFLMVGKSGSGKTTVLHDHVQQVAARGEHALIFDPDGSFIERFYRSTRGDVILNPWDKRSHCWDMLGDIKSIFDAQRVAAILLPKPGNAGDNAFWFDQARTLLAHILQHHACAGCADLAALSVTLNNATAEELQSIAMNTPAARIFEAGGERATASVLFMMAIAARAVATLATVSKDAPSFSFDRFYADLSAHDGSKPMIFLAAPRRYRESGAQVIAAFIDAAAAAILQRDTASAAKAWMFLDELASLPPVQSLLTLLPEGRKYSACVVIAFQSIAQLRQAFGSEGAEIIAGQTATQLIMATGDSATAKWAVELFGSAEVENQRATESLGHDPKGNGSIAIHRERKAIVVDSELTNLAVGEGFLRLSGLPIAKLRIKQTNPLEAIAPAFIEAPLAAKVSPPMVTRMEDRDDWLSLGGQ